MERNKERRPKNEAHRSSSAPPVYLVSGWLRVTGAQVSDGAASLRPPPPHTHTDKACFLCQKFCFFTFFGQG